MSTIKNTPPATISKTTSTQEAQSAAATNAAKADALKQAVKELAKVAGGDLQKFAQAIGKQFGMKPAQAKEFAALIEKDLPDIGMAHGTRGYEAALKNTSNIA